MEWTAKDYFTASKWCGIAACISFFLVLMWLVYKAYKGHGEGDAVVTSYSIRLKDGYHTLKSLTSSDIKPGRYEVLTSYSDGQVGVEFADVVCKDTSGNEVVHKESGIEIRIGTEGGFLC